MPVGTPEISGGTESISISTAVLNGQSYLVETPIFTYPLTSAELADPGFTTTVPTYDYQQDSSSRSLYRTGTNGSLLRTPALSLPGTWYAGESNSASSTLSDGTSYSVVFKVEEEEPVTVPAGTFLTWKTIVTETTIGPAPVSAPDTVTGTYWYAPQIGSYVKANTQTQTEDQTSGVVSTTTFDFQMTGTSTQ